MTAIAVRIPRLTRHTWYRHRVTLLGVAAGYAAVAGWLLASGASTRAFLSAHHLDGCLNPAGVVYSHSECTSASWLAFANDGFWVGIISLGVLAMVPIMAMFAGLPWLTREFETGSFRYTWVQSVSPLRWLLATFGQIALISAIGAGLCGAAFGWWHQVTQWRTGFMEGPWYSDTFYQTPLSMVSWTLLAMALALLWGVLLRRTIPAMAAFAVSFLGLLFLTAWRLLGYLLRIAPVVKREPLAVAESLTVRWDDYDVNFWYSDASGHRLSLATENKLIGQHSTTWMSQHYTFWVAYQPADRAWIFQLAAAAILLTVAGAMISAAIWLFRKRAA
jgi:hypothetical protein